MRLPLRMFFSILALQHSMVFASAPSVEERIQMLHTGNWLEESHALSKLAWEDVERSTALQSALIKALRGEGYGSRSAEIYGEDLDYQNFDGQLTLLMQRIAAELGNAEAYAALVETDYNPGSELEQWLARQPPAWPYIEKMTHSSNWEQQGNALYLLGDILRTAEATCSTSLTPALRMRGEWLAQLREFALHGSGTSRMSAADALALAGDKSAYDLIASASNRERDQYIRGTQLLALKTMRERLNSATPPCRP